MIPASVGAIESGLLGAYPTGQSGSSTSWLQYHLVPGQRDTGSISVNNRSAYPEDLLLYPVDAAPNGDGGFGMDPQYIKPSDAGAWVTLSQSRLHLLPHSTQQVSLNFQVPKNASVCPHYAGIIVQPTQTQTDTHSGYTIHVVSRLGVRLYETVPGVERPRLAITSLRHQSLKHGQAFPVSLHNSGNTILTPRGQLTIFNEFGRTVATSRFNLGQSMKPAASATTTVASTLSGSWLPQRYQAKLTLAFGTHPRIPTAERTVIFWTGHPLIWLIATIVIMLGWIVIITIQRYRDH